LAASPYVSFLLAPFEGFTEICCLESEDLGLPGVYLALLMEPLVL
jgi:hypothetical protein